MRKIAISVAVSVTMLLAGGSAAQAAVTEAFDGSVSCTTQPALPAPLPGNEYAGQRWCGTGTSSALARSTVPSWDGTPIDVNFALPPEPESGRDGPWPVMMVFHGWAGSKSSFQSMQRWLSRGYAVFSMTDRGFHESCGSVASRLASGGACENGYIRLLDTRYEVRDAQFMAGLLVDDGLISPTKIASSGGSYGGGLSMALAALKNRVMLPGGGYAPWQSPGGTPMSLAVATPSIPWTDLAYSLVPNGGTLDYIEDASYFGRFGVMKESWVNTLYTLGNTVGEGSYTQGGADPSADLTGWKALLDAGEPYDGKPEAEAIIEEITANHSSYYIDASTQPAPLLIYSGFTDDLFPADEALRYYNRTRARYPAAKIGLVFGPNSGHMRGMSKSDASAIQADLEEQWVDFYLKGQGTEPAPNVRAMLQTCPANAPVGEPFTAPDWASISPGEIRLIDPAPQRISPTGGDPVTGGIFNPAPTGQACSTALGTKELGTANYETDPAPAGGFTVLGSPTVVAKITQTGNNSQIAARLVDVDSNGLSKVLVARGLWRPDGNDFQVFQLHANGWKVEEGHRLRLELLPKDASLPAGGILNYGRPSNGQAEVVVSELDLRIPVAERPGALGGLIKKPAPKVLPDRPGVKLAPGYGETAPVPIDDYRPPGSQPASRKLMRLKVRGLRITAKSMRLKLTCPKAAERCPTTWVRISGTGRGYRVVLARYRGVRISPGRTRTVTTKLTSRGRKSLSRLRTIRLLKVRVRVKSGVLNARTITRTAKASP